MIVFFVHWLEECMSVKKNDMHIKLHLYKDMQIDEYQDFWAKKLKVSNKIFEKPYIKDSKLVNLSYRNGFGKGTCNVRIHNRDKTEYITQALKYIAKLALP